MREPRHGAGYPARSSALSVSPRQLAKLLGFGAETTMNALSLAASLGAGLDRQTGSGAHVVEAGFAGRNGIMAAHLAERGLTGNPTIMEGMRWPARLISISRLALVKMSASWRPA
jgi:hypothetical protein